MTPKRSSAPGPVLPLPVIRRIQPSHLRLPAYASLLEYLLINLLPEKIRCRRYTIHELLTHFLSRTPVIPDLEKAIELRNRTVHPYSPVAVTENDRIGACGSFDHAITAYVLPRCSDELRASALALHNRRQLELPVASYSCLFWDTKFEFVKRDFSTCAYCNAPLFGEHETRNANLSLDDWFLCPVCKNVNVVVWADPIEFGILELDRTTLYIEAFPAGTSSIELRHHCLKLGIPTKRAFVPKDMQERYFYKRGLVVVEEFRQVDQALRLIKTTSYCGTPLKVRVYTGEPFETTQTDPVPYEEVFRLDRCCGRDVTSRYCKCGISSAPKCRNCGECYCLYPGEFDYTEGFCSLCQATVLGRPTPTRNERGCDRVRLVRRMFQAAGTQAATGVVSLVTAAEVIVDCGLSEEGLIPLEWLGGRSVQVGDPIRYWVAPTDLQEIDGYVILIPESSE